ncbi:MAG: type II CAAX prenyl endopeptidase Rce1 family protein [bacterium]
MNNGWDGNFRTGTDLLIKQTLKEIGLHFGIVLFIVGLCVAWLLKDNGKEVRTWLQNPIFIVGNVLESLLYGLLLGVIIGGITGFFLSQQSLSAETRVIELVMNLGAGIYEEFIFRFILLSGLVSFFKKTMPRKYIIGYGVAVIISSLIFAASHHLPVFVEPMLYEAFLFRFFAGICFAAIFIFRGYGVAAYSHSFYNLFLMLR